MISLKTTEVSLLLLLGIAEDTLSKILNFLDET